jgi:hypothetical protein
MNVDEAGRPVFDAVLPFIAGASRGEFNHRYALPSEMLAPGLGQLPPFDLVGLLANQRAAGGVPKVVTVNTASEYWRADGSLGHVSLDGQADLEIPEGARSYFVAGTDHVGAAAMVIALPGSPRNHLSPMPGYRAILDAARRWVVDDVEPPPSRVPRLAAGTAGPRAEVLGRFDVTIGVRAPELARFLTRHELDLGPQADAGIPRYPVVVGREYPAFVSAVDDDGNEVAGVSLPELTVPLATHTGWSDLLAQGRQWDPLAVLSGNSHPFAADEAARRATGDRRRSIAERYKDRADYLTRVRSAADSLVAERFLLAVDVDAVVDRAGLHYDELTSDSRTTAP